MVALRAQKRNGVLTKAHHQQTTQHFKMPQNAAGQVNPASFQLQAENHSESMRGADTLSFNVTVLDFPVLPWTSLAVYCPVTALDFPGCLHVYS